MKKNLLKQKRVKLLLPKGQVKANQAILIGPFRQFNWTDKLRGENATSEHLLLFKTTWYDQIAFKLNQCDFEI